MSVVGRFDDGDYRWYVDPLDESRYESVTAIISAANAKPWLSPWAAKLAAQYAVEHHDFIGTSIREAGAGPTVALISNAAKAKREMKADIGTHQHNMVEALILDHALPSVPDHLVDAEVDGERVDQDAITDGFLNFVSDFSPTFHLAEATVSNERHRYAGTLDFVASFPAMTCGRPGGRRGLVDVKSGVVLDSTMGAQLAAYRRADTVWLDSMGGKAPMVDVDFAAVLHLRQDYARGYKLLEVPAGPEQFDWFTAMARQYHMGLDLGKLERRALYPPLPDGSQPPPLLEDTSLRCRKALVAAGHTNLGDLLGLTVPTLLAVKGVGPKAVEAIAALLNDWQAGRPVADPITEEEVA
jgi:hypothetical protein